MPRAVWIICLAVSLFLCLTPALVLSLFLEQYPQNYFRIERVLQLFPLILILSSWMGRFLLSRFGPRFPASSYEELPEELWPPTASAIASC